jgi:metallophosphoesterase (TIGR03767 family)
MTEVDAAGRPRTTLETTLVRGAPDANGYRKHVEAEGEPYSVRNDLGGMASADRAERRRTLLSFVQFTDVHVQDTQSPARFEFLDRFDLLGETPFKAAYRAHEMLTTQVAEAMVRTVRDLAVGPATGSPTTFALNTGDAVDNCQWNELRWGIDILDGGRIVPDSGALGRFEGVADPNPDHDDDHYWHPDGSPDGGVDEYRKRHGFPLVPGLLDAAIRPFEATGLGMPWFAVHGNHDALLAGNFPVGPLLDGLAVGDRKPAALPSNLGALEFVHHAGAGHDAVRRLMELVPFRQVTPDGSRRLLSRTEVVEEHFVTTGSPVGHGYTDENRRAGTAYYALDLPTVDGGDERPVRMIVLDTVNEHGGADGSLDAEQFRWLGAVLAERPDRPTMIVSHHSGHSMGNGLGGDGAAERVLGDDVIALFHRHPQVLLWVNGHTHENTVTPRPAHDRVGGFWEVTTASHIDWPQQARTLELVDNGDGTMSVFGTILDFRAPTVWNGSLEDPIALASLSRELAANDPQENARPRVGVDGLRGSVRDRNVELIVPTPPGLTV